MRAYFDGTTTEIPLFFRDKIRRNLGVFNEYLPPGALYHDPNAYLKSSGAGRGPVGVSVRNGRSVPVAPPAAAPSLV